MTKNRRRCSYTLAILAVTAAFEIGTSEARAYWGWEGFGSFNYVPQPIDFLNQHALINAANATRGPVMNHVYANNPNSYANRLRDNGFVPHSSVETRRPPAAQSNRTRSANVSQTNNTQTSAAPSATTVPRPVVPIGSFFDPSRRLVWPADAPVAGDLRAKRDVSDAACLAVADLVKTHGSAPITTVTNARRKLLDYGQPALEFMRAETTWRVAESFHLFLLSLYEALEQAANPPSR